METLLERCKRLALEANSAGDDTNYFFYEKMARLLTQIGTLVDPLDIEANLLLIVNKRVADVE